MQLTNSESAKTFGRKFSNGFDDSFVAVFDPSNTLLRSGIQSLKVWPLVAISNAGESTTGNYPTTRNDAGLRCKIYPLNEL